MKDGVKVVDPTTMVSIHQLSAVTQQLEPAFPCVSVHHFEDVAGVRDRGHLARQLFDVRVLL